MELPPVTVPPGAASPLPAFVTGVVQSVLAPNRYAVQVQGLLLELEADLFLTAGDKLPLRVARQTPREVVFELVRPSQPSQARPLEPDRAASHDPELVHEFVRMRAPLDPALLERAAPLAQDPPTRQAAAFLAAHGVDLTAQNVSDLAALAVPPPADSAEEPPALLAPLAEALEEQTAATPRDVATAAPRAAGPPSQALEEIVARVLDGSPRLQMIDRLIEAVTALEPATVPAKEAAARLDQALRLVRAADPANVEETLRALPPLPREALREVLRELQAMERKQLASTPLLSEARDAQSSVLDTAQRTADLRLVNQLSRIRDDGIVVLEVPVRSEGRVTRIPLRIRREPEKPGAPGTGPRFSVTVDADLSRIGLVRAHLESAGKTLRVRLRTREAGVRSHLERGAGELAEALQAQGYEAQVAAELVAALERESIFDVFAAPGEPTTLDVTL